MTRPPEIYLNDAATSWPKAPGVVEAVCEAIEMLPGHSERSIGEHAHFPGRLPAGQVVRECRTRLALRLGVANPERVIFPTSVTHALNLALWGMALTLSPSDRVITSVAEHNSVLRPLRHAARLRGFDIRTVGLDGDLSLSFAQFADELAGGAALVVLTHASNVTGRIYPVERFFRLAKEAGAVTLLDASQSMGHVPISPADLFADMVAFPGHKGLRGPVGVGVLYVSPGIDLAQVFVGGTGGWSDVFFQPEEMPVRLEAGTPNLPVIAGLNQALCWHEKEGEEAIRREEGLAAMLRQGLRAVPGLRIFDDVPGARYSPVVSFKVEGKGVEETGRALVQEHGIVCRAGLHCAPLIHAYLGTPGEGTVRFSVSGFNTGEEIDRTLQAVRAVALKGC